MGIIVFLIWNLVLFIAIFVTGALASAVPVIEYNYYSLAQSILIGVLILTWIITYVVLGTAADLKDKKRKK